MITTSGKAGHPRAKVNIPMWTMKSALLLVKQLQSRLWAHHHHVALGGSVLNHGESAKDLDLYVLPFGGPAETHDSVAVDEILSEVMGYESIIGDSNYPQQPEMRSRDRYSYKGKRVDVFVVKGQR